MTTGLEATLPGVVHFTDSNGEVVQREARLLVSPAGITCETAAGDRFHLPWQGLAISRGGVAGEHVVLRARDGLVALSDHPDFPRALEGAGGNDVVDRLEKLGAGPRTRTAGAKSCVAVLLLGLVGLWYAPSAYRASITGIVESLPMSVDREVGEVAAGTMDPGGSEVTDEVVVGAMRTMLERLTPHLSGELGDGTYEVELRVVQNDTPNAFALPGGFVTVFTGLIEAADRPEMVAGVLAHELAHAELRHGMRGLAHRVGIMAGLRLFVGDSNGLLGLASEVFTLATVNDYSQDQESEADARGVELLLAARLDASALADFFRHLDEEHGDVPDALVWASTHPRNVERIAAITAAIPEGAEVVPLELDWDAVRDRL